MDMIETNWMDAKETTLCLPVAGEASETLVTLISGGQPVLLVRDGRPVAVVVDLDSYQESEALAASA
jgi:PHD/YefM family antitoxin component YafN of YafNO toxin-antitoxin module